MHHGPIPASRELRLQHTPRRNDSCQAGCRYLDTALSQKSQLNVELTLERAKKRIRQKKWSVNNRKSSRHRRWNIQPLRAPVSRKTKEETVPTQENRRHNPLTHEGVKSLWRETHPQDKCPAKGCVMPEVQEERALQSQMSNQKNVRN